MNYNITESITWFHACKKNDVPENGGVCVKYKENQIALFYLKRRDEWFASQNLCPHRRQMALSRSIISSLNGEPNISCPFHKKHFRLLIGVASMKKMIAASKAIL